MDTHHKHIGHSLVYSEKDWSHWAVEETQWGLRLVQSSETEHSTIYEPHGHEVRTLICKTCDVELEVPEDLI